MFKHLSYLAICLSLIPSCCLGDMVGYTGDIRKYVTDEEKTQFPYNTVVHIYNKKTNNAIGTGTFVSKDIILSCKHVLTDAGRFNYIGYKTTDGKKYSGLVGPYSTSTDKANDFGWIINKNAFNGDVLKLSPKTDFSYKDHLMVIGYDWLKPLTEEEIGIIHQVYLDVIKKEGKMTSKNNDQITAGVIRTLQDNHSCKSDNDKKCVRCSGEFCIFSDSDNLKVRKGCKITEINNRRIVTNCPGSPGASGSAIINADTNEIVGILCQGLDDAIIGERKYAVSEGVRPEKYYKQTKTLIDAISPLVDNQELKEFIDFQRSQQ